MLVESDNHSVAATDSEAKSASVTMASRSDWSSDDWYDRLSRPGRKLVELHAVTEDRFLSFGAFLSDFHKRATAVSRLATSIHEKMVGEEASGEIANLQLLVERMSLFLHDIRTESERNSRALTDICSALEYLHQPLQAFQRITKTLQVVGITTRVECSGFDEGEANVTHLSDSIRHLGNLIAGNMHDIIDQVAVLQKLSQEALRNEAALNSGESSRAMAVVEQARSVLLKLVDNKNSALQQSESLSQASDAVASNIAEIVSSIQFHDITRQQVEHVAENLDAFKDAVVRQFEEGAKDERAAVEREVAAGCRLQSEQLANSRDELTAAVWRIVESLQSLAASVTTLAFDIRCLSGDTERDGTTFFEAIEPAIESVAAVLNENLVTAGHSARAVNEVVAAAEIMAHQVEEIERFGAEMKVVALNASIESVHVKAGGTSLGVIADSIQDLAREALIQTEELATGLRSITASADTLRTAAGSDQGDQDEKIDSLIADSDALLSGLRQSNAALLDDYTLMDQQAESLALDIADVAESITVHEDASVIINQAIEQLDLISDRFGVAGLRGHGSELFNQMQTRYSMQSERDIHDKQDFGETSSRQTAEPEETEATGGNAPDHGLGANVELF